MTMARFDFSGKRVVITQPDDFMGPTLCRLFADSGATVIADRRSLRERGQGAALIAEAGHVDILIAQLGIPAPSTPAVDVGDDEWRDAFATMVDPLQELTRAVLPQMIARKAGKILVMGSASALRGMKRASTYSAARGAQLAYVQAVGVEVAPHRVQVNAIAQNLVDNPMYFPPEVQAMPAFQERIRREMPLGRLVSAEEDARFAAYLCTDAADCFVGQIFPVCGGWAPR
ncbi:MAG: SDR family oxidoreductase [Burkholderiaceae bacterium]